MRELKRKKGEMEEFDEKERGGERDNELGKGRKGDK